MIDFYVAHDCEELNKYYTDYRIGNDNLKIRAAPTNLSIRLVVKGTLTDI